MDARALAEPVLGARLRDEGLAAAVAARADAAGHAEPAQVDDGLVTVPRDRDRDGRPHHHQRLPRLPYGEEARRQHAVAHVAAEVRGRGPPRVVLPEVALGPQHEGQLRRVGGEVRVDPAVQRPRLLVQPQQVLVRDVPADAVEDVLRQDLEAGAARRQWERHRGAVEVLSEGLLG